MPCEMTRRLPVTESSQAWRWAHGAPLRRNTTQWKKAEDRARLCDALAVNTAAKTAA
jgi:phage gp16-like protein